MGRLNAHGIDVDEMKRLSDSDLCQACGTFWEAHAATCAGSDDPICHVCGEPRSVHVPTASGPLTHPREARGEGTYVLVHGPYWRGTGPWDPNGDEYMPATYRFEAVPP